MTETIVFIKLVIKHEDSINVFDIVDNILNNGDLQDEINKSRKYVRVQSATSHDRNSPEVTCAAHEVSL